MRPGEVKRLVEENEGQRTEFKESFAQTRDAIHTLCAFAHSVGGTVLFGVRNDKSIVGVQLGPKTLDEFVDKISQNTSPRLRPSIEPIEVDGHTVVTATILSLPPDQVCFAYNCAFIRVGASTRHMTQDEVKRRHFEAFKAEASSGHFGSPPPTADLSWMERERLRVETYISARGLFLVHEWRPSVDEDQVADVVIYVRQHPGLDQPLMDGKIKSVEYHLGPKFAKSTIVKTDQDTSFRMEISAYGPLLCLARVNFDDGHAPITLSRYVDF